MTRYVTAQEYATETGLPLSLVRAMARVRRDGDGWLAIAHHEGEDVTVSGATRGEAAANLRRECWRDYDAEQRAADAMEAAVG